jgi:hypothetical protein
MNPTTEELMDLLLEPAMALRKELGASYDLVCVPEAEAAALNLGERLKRTKNAIKWHDQKTGAWICLDHNSPDCPMCR